MDNGEVYARIAEMRDSSTAIGRSANRIREAIDAVDGEVRALGPDRFMSLGAEAFRSEYHRATPRLREAFDQLLRFRDQLNDSADDIEVASRSSR